MSYRRIAFPSVVLSLFVVLALVWAAVDNTDSAKRHAKSILTGNTDSIVKAIEPCIVGLWGVDAPGGGPAQSAGLIGCGIIMNSRGYVLTSAGLKDGIESIHIIDSNSKKYESTLVATDKKTGLSVLKMVVDGSQEGSTFQVARLSDSSLLKAGDMVVALGGRTDPASWQLTSRAGSIVGTRQSLIVGGVKHRHLLQTDLKLSSENVGGPLIDAKGDVVGFALPSIRLASTPDNVTYALPINLAQSFFSSLPIPEWSHGIDGPIISWAGAEMAPLDPLIFTQTIPARKKDVRGSVVNYVKNNSPAERAGLRVDDVVTHIDGAPINDALAIDRRMPDMCKAQKAKVRILRKGRARTLVVDWRYTSTSVLRRSGSLAEVVLVVLILTLMYYLVYRNVFDRAILFLLCAASLAFIGQQIGFYGSDSVAAALLSKMDVLCFIAGMQLITGVLEEAGALEYVAKRITLFTAGDRWRIMLLFCCVTYTFSLFVNNLTTVIIVAPMIINLSRHLRFDPKPFLISVLIASNLGGASTMIGDFPNMLIGAETGLSFFKFMIYMLPICILELLIVLAYVRVARHSLFERGEAVSFLRGSSLSAKQADSNAYNDCEKWIEDLPELSNKNKGAASGAFFREMERSLPGTIRNRRALRRGLLILGGVLVGFLVADFMNWSPATIVLAGGIAALAFGACDRLSLLQRVRIRDLIFFAGLFVIVGAAEAAGALDYVAKALVTLSFGNLLVLSLLLMWSAAFVTCFFNAGPTAALFLPLVLSLESAAPHNLYWWALSLGICAGSSGSLTGATAGSVVANMFDASIKEGSAGVASNGELGLAANGLTFKEYGSLGFPVMLILLVVSSVYVSMIFSL